MKKMNLNPGYILSLILIALLTVGCDDAGNPVAARIVLGSGSAIEIPNSQQYELPFVVQVTDEMGNAAANTVVSLSVVPEQYSKGQWIQVDTNTPPDGQVDEWRTQINVNCINEDLNRNAVLEAGEDINGNGVLDPTNGATITASSTLIPTLDPIFNTITTDATGFGHFTVTYPKSEAIWTTVLLSATATVNGTERLETNLITLPIAAADVADVNIAPPGGTLSRYGVAGVCTDPN